MTISTTRWITNIPSHARLSKYILILKVTPPALTATSENLQQLTRVSNSSSTTQRNKYNNNISYSDFSNIKRKMSRNISF